MIQDLQKLEFSSNYYAEKQIYTQGDVRILKMLVERAVESNDYINICMVFILFSK